jgi:carbon monoxide dehydrogenase subunit G
MAFTVEVDFVRRFEVDCPYDRAFDVLSDVPESASHFPNVDALVDLGDNAFRWEMKKIGIDRFYIQTVYACKYTDNREKGWVKWTPVKGEGNGLLKGKWTIKSLDADRTRIDLATGGELTVPLPGLVKLLVAPFVVAEFNKMVDKYIHNLTTALETKPKRKATRRM